MTPKKTTVYLMNRSVEKTIEEFSNYLKVLGYSKATYSEDIGILKEFSQFLDGHDRKGFKGVKKEMVSGYVEMLKQRENKKKKGEKLSIIHINSHINTLKRFSEYLWKVKDIKLPVAHLKRLKEQWKERESLTIKEIQEIYKVIHPTNREGIRDRAILAVFYGCGLRKSEGEALKIKDINFSTGFLHVRNGKGNKERLVPMSRKVSDDLREYINVGRRFYIKEKRRNQHLFLTFRGEQMQGQSMLNRLKILLSKTEIKNKKVGLHTLRHSIATHLLENDMELEDISAFLGHSSLESTQIYTHIDEQKIHYFKI